MSGLLSKLRVSRVRSGGTAAGYAAVSFCFLPGFFLFCKAPLAAAPPFASAPGASVTGLFGAALGLCIGWYAAKRRTDPPLPTPAPSSAAPVVAEVPDPTLHHLCEESIRVALDAARAGAFEIDVKARRILVSKSVHTLLGFTNGHCPELETYLDRIHRHDRPQVESLIEHSIKHGTGHFVEYRVPQPTGTDRWISARAEPLFDGEGKVNRLTGTLIDVTDRKQAESALQESEKRIRSLFEHNIDGIFSVDLQGRFVDANPAAVRISGYSLQELRERQFTDICAPEYLEATVASFHRTVAGISQRLETAVIRKDGSRAELLVQGMPMYVNGEVVGMFGVAEDVTERKVAVQALAEQERRLQLALAAGQMGLWTLDVKSSAIEFDAADCGLFGIDAPGGTFSGEEVFSKVHADDRDRLRREFSELLAGQRDFESEFRVLLGSGETRWLAARGRLVPDAAGTASTVVGVAFDITERHLATEQLSMAKIAAEAASRAKDEFLAALSHELRTPLNPVLMLASEHERDTTLPPTLQADFALIRKNVELEQHLIDDLLDLTRIARGKLRLDRKPLDLHAVVQDVAQMLRADLDAKPVHLTLELGAAESLALADAVRMKQVVWNLLRNAVKFTPIQGRITLETQNHAPGKFLLRVTDTGIGVRKEHLDRIFSAFEQGDPDVNRRFGGLGLGLAICRTLVDLHEGRIWASSDGCNCGTCFHLELRTTAPAPLPDPLYSPPAASPASMRRILLVEDDEGTRHTMERLLLRRGHHVTSAASASAAAAAARTSQFDLLISDIGLPDGSGHELMSQLRHTPGLQGIALSGYGMDEDIARSLASGFARHLTKPINIEQLEGTLTELALQQIKAPAKEKDSTILPA